MVNKLRNLIIMVVAAAAVCACGGKKSFKIECEVKGLGSQAIEMIYCGDGGVERVSTVSTEGRFILEGSSVEPALVEIEAAGRPLIELVVKNGDKIKCKLNADDPAEVEISGSKDMKLYGQWLAENAKVLSGGDAASVNRAVASFVGNNRSSMASTMLVMLRFTARGHEAEADSLIGLIEAEARPESLTRNIVSAVGQQMTEEARSKVKAMNLYTAGDSICHYYPYSHSMTLLVFSGPSAKDESLRAALKALRSDKKHSELALIEVSLDPDSASWRRSIEGDSARWVQGWIAGSAASAAIRYLAVPRYPFYILADSMGNQLYRGEDMSLVRTKISEKRR